MHLKTTNPQCFVPRLPQRLISSYAIQSVQVVQAEAAADQRADETSDQASHGAADTSCAANLALRGLSIAVVWLCSSRSSRGRLAGSRRLGRRIFVLVTVWHDPSPCCRRGCAFIH